jgi:hypothetical protein
MLLWSATKGILRLLAERMRVSAKTQNPSALITNLFSQGVIDKNQYWMLERAAKYRNSAVHAYRVEQIDQEFFEYWANLALSLLARLTDDQEM